MDIDPTTNLPVLPKGEFWRVSRMNKINPYGHYYRNAPNLVGKVYLMRTNCKKHWWNNPKPEVLASAWVEQRPVGRPMSYDFTPETILATAEKILILRERSRRVKIAERAEQDRINSLMGDYPPKSL